MKKNALKKIDISIYRIISERKCYKTKKIMERKKKKSCKRKCPKYHQIDPPICEIILI